MEKVVVEVAGAGAVEAGAELGLGLGFGAGCEGGGVELAGECEGNARMAGDEGIAGGLLAAGIDEGGVEIGTAGGKKGVNHAGGLGDVDGGVHVGAAADSGEPHEAESELEGGRDERGGHEGGLLGAGMVGMFGINKRDVRDGATEQESPKTLSLCANPADGRRLFSSRNSPAGESRTGSALGA